MNLIRLPQNPLSNSSRIDQGIHFSRPNSALSGLVYVTGGGAGGGGPGGGGFGGFGGSLEFFWDHVGITNFAIALSKLTHLIKNPWPNVQVSQLVFKEASHPSNKKEGVDPKSWAGDYKSIAHRLCETFSVFPLFFSPPRTPSTSSLAASASSQTPSPTLLSSLTRQFSIAEQRLLTAARDSDIEGVKRALLGELDVNARDMHEETALHHAARNGNLEIVETLLRHPKQESKRARSALGRTPLHLAVIGGHLEVVKLLLQGSQKLDLSAKDSAKKTPLEYAVENDHWEVAEILLDQILIRQQLSHPLFEQEAFFKLIEKASDQFVEKILKHPKVINQLAQIDFSRFLKALLACKNKDSFRKLAQYFNKSDNANIKALKELWAVNVIKKYCELVSSEKDDKEAFLHLYKAVQILFGVFSSDVIYFRDSESNTPIKLAIKHNCRVLVQQILEHSAKMSDVEKREIIHYAARFGSLQVFHQLIETFGAKILNKSDEFGNTALHWAMRYRQIELAKAIVSNEAFDQYDVSCSKEIDERVVTSITLLHLAVSTGDLELTKAIYKKMDSKMYTFKTSYGANVLHYAVVGGNPKVLNFLLRHLGKKLVNEADQFNQTLLHVAVQEKNLEMVSILMDYLPFRKFNLKNSKGQTALQIAMELKQPEIVRELIQIDAVTIKEHELEIAFESNCLKTILLLIKYLDEPKVEKKIMNLWLPYLRSHNFCNALRNAKLDLKDSVELLDFLHEKSSFSEKEAKGLTKVDWEHLFDEYNIPQKTQELLIKIWEEWRAGVDVQQKH